MKQVPNFLLYLINGGFLDDYQQKFIGPSPEWVTDDVPGGRLVLI